MLAAVRAVAAGGIVSSSWRGGGGGGVRTLWRGVGQAAAVRAVQDGAVLRVQVPGEALPGAQGGVQGHRGGGGGSCGGGASGGGGSGSAGGGSLII